MGAAARVRGSGGGGGESLWSAVEVGARKTRSCSRSHRRTRLCAKHVQLIFVSTFIHAHDAARRPDSRSQAHPESLEPRHSSLCEKRGVE